MKKYGGLKIKQGMSFNPARVVEQDPKNTKRVKVEYFVYDSEPRD